MSYPILKQVKSRTACESFLCTARSSCAQLYRHNSCKVQPTALSIRKGDITGGSKKRLLFHPAKEKPDKKRFKKSIQTNAIKHLNSNLTNDIALGTKYMYEMYKCIPHI